MLVVMGCGSDFLRGWLFHMFVEEVFELWATDLGWGDS